MSHLRAIYDVKQTTMMNEHNKEAGIRNFLRKIEDDFVRTGQPCTHNGIDIRYRLDAYGGITTPGYTLNCVSTKGRRYRLEENGKVIMSGRMDTFSARAAYSIVSYND
jgi:hypothetical protein